MTDRNKGDVYIDPNFFLPPNVIDLRYAPEDKDSDSNLDEFDAPVDITATDPIEADPDIFWTTETAESSGMIPIPESITIVSQVTRSLAGGGYVIDVTFDVQDIPGVESFDLSVIKV